MANGTSVKTSSPESLRIAVVQARFARQSLGIDQTEMVDITGALERTKTLGMMRGYILVEDKWLPDEDARWDPEEHIIVIRREVFENASSGDARSRFTIAHELAHCWLGHKFLRNRRTSERPEFGRQRAIDELAANAFAGEFLAPAHLIRLGEGGASASAIVRLFGLSEAAARRRVRDMGPMRKHLKRQRSRMPANQNDEQLDMYEEYMRGVLRAAVAFPDV